VETPGGPAPMVRLVISHGTLPGRMTDIALADRLITALGGRVQHSDDQTVISVPAAPDGPIPALGSKATAPAVADPTPTPTAGQGSITK
jgi:hypothetical protein